MNPRQLPVDIRQTPRGRSDLLDAFLAFVSEMERQRAGVERPRRAAIESAVPTLSMPSVDFPLFLLDAPVSVAEQQQEPAIDPLNAPQSVDAEVLLERLQSYIETSAKMFAPGASDVMLAQYREVQYAMVALADDVFLQEVEWDGREAWQLNHLEQRLFRSRLAGDRIFDRMDALLASGDRRLVQLASVYLCMLSLGFKGRYRVEGGDIRIRGYAKRLFEMMTDREPSLFQTWSEGTLRPIVPAAYTHTVRGDSARRGRWYMPWWMLAAAIVVAWIVIGQVVWMLAGSAIGNAAEMVLRAAGSAS